MMVYRVIAHTDVWGNPSEGFFVNDSFELEDLLEITDTVSDESLWAALKAANIIKRYVTLDDIEFEHVGPKTIYVNRKLDGYPYFTLIRVEEERG